MENNSTLSKLGQSVKLGLYEHFKGGKYKVLSVAKYSEDLTQEFVVYESLNTGETWVRPLEMFTENIERDNYKGPRFKFIK
jgi:hypothetical protein